MGLASLLLKGAGKGAQLASKIKVAKANKVANTIRKTCSKGKNCSATCIAASKICLVSMSPPVTDASNKMAKFLKSRQTPGGTFTKAKGVGKAPTINSLTTESLREKAESNIRLIDYRLENKRRVGDQVFSNEPEKLARWNSQYAPLQNLTNEQKAALGFYGENVKQYYKDVNQFLRSGKSPTELETDSVVKFTVQNLKEGLARLPAEPKELRRAVSGKFAQQLDNLKVGSVIEDKGFGSYTDKGAPTLNQFISKTEPNAVLTVKSKTARDVSEAMEYNEGEHLSMPGTKYRVVDIQPKGFYSRKTGEYSPEYILEEI